jgi:hypothetical protein
MEAAMFTQGYLLLAFLLVVLLLGKWQSGHGSH